MHYFRTAPRIIIVMECPVKNDGINNLFLSRILIYISFPSFSWDTRWRSWIRNLRYKLGGRGFDT